jgi:purine-binding chemotaxis protein CheW
VNIHGTSPASNAAVANAAAGPLADRAEFISFAIGEEQYGVDIMAVREIKGWSNVTHLPNQPDYVRGVLNLRGVMVPIVDLRCRFGHGHTETTRPARISPRFPLPAFHFEWRPRCCG